ncbi:hypothetical protein AJ87_20065 [Rhizobium yanglingense]|nr:hypothetical protein AJ87_20065 [Rhizobium yanglingense]
MVSITEVLVNQPHTWAGFRSAIRTAGSVDEEASRLSFSLLSVGEAILDTRVLAQMEQFAAECRMRRSQ